MPADNNKAEILLSVGQISLSFGGVRALEDINFDINKKEIFAIIGPNGAGKTSMLNVINGFYHPQQGEIYFKGLHRKQMRPHDAAVQGVCTGVGFELGCFLIRSRFDLDWDSFPR